jgi:hypothetical protein
MGQLGQEQAKRCVSHMGYGRRSNIIKVLWWSSNGGSNFYQTTVLPPNSPYSGDVQPAHRIAVVVWIAGTSRMFVVAHQPQQFH